MRILHSKALLCLASLWLAACPGDDSTTDDAGASGTASSTTEAAQTTTDPGATIGTTEEPGTTSSTTETPADSGTTGPGAACGETDCSEDQWCDFSDDACGADAGGSASCEPRPEGCPENYAPVCGCDGQVHGNDCDANAAGVDLDAEGDCETPEGYFRCGYRFCSLGFEYCQVQISDIGGFGDSYNCMPAAKACMDELTCDCLMGEPCWDFGCNPTADGGVEIVCPGG
jgi:hypothetical protein